MDSLSLSRNFIGKFLSIEEQEAYLSLAKTLDAIDIFPQLRETLILSAACIASLSTDFFLKKTNTRDFILALSPHNRDVLHRALGEEDIDSVVNHQEVHQTLHRLFRVPLSINTTTPTYRNEPLQTIEPPHLRFKDLKNYQAQLADKIWNHLQISSYSKCILQMPTGTGKTRTSIDIVCRYFNSYDDYPQVLWLCNTEELADQALSAFVDTYRFLAQSPVSAKNCMKSSVQLPQDKAHFLVASIQSISANTNLEAQEKIKNRGIVLSRLRLIVLDEAHIATAPTYKTALETLTEYGAPFLGLTATPGRGHRQFGETQNEEFAAFFNRNVFSLEFPGIDTIDELVRRQIMSKAFFHPIEGASIENILSQQEIERMHLHKAIPKKLIKLISSNGERNATIVSLLDRILRDGKRVIYFGSSVHQSKLTSGMLGIMGHRSAHVDGQSGSERSSSISGYRNGQIQCLCNYGVLSTGFDDPSTDVVFIGRVTNSIVLYSQMIGRGLRGRILGGTDLCDVYTVIDNIADLPENKEIYNYFSGYYDGPEREN